MKRVCVVGAAVAAMLVPAAPAAAAQDPLDINCGIVSCTYKVEQAIEEAQGATAGVEECVRNGVGALQDYLQGTPQPGVCNP